MHELQIRFSLVRNESCILSGETSIMLDRVVQAQFGQIEMACSIRSIEKIRGEFGNEETKRGGEIEGLSDFDVEIFERDVLPIVREYAVVCHCVQHGAC